MKVYRAAIVGTGSIGSTHVKALRAAGSRVEIVAAVSIDEAQVKTFCAEHQIPSWYADTTDMLAAVQPDLVIVATPNGTHFEVSSQCLQAGAWVLCEKPLCSSLAQFDELKRLEASTGNYIGTVFQWRFGSSAKHVKHLIDDAVFGRPLVGTCQTLWYRGLAYYQVPWRGTWAGESGGATVTLGIHLMDLFLWLMGDWQDVYAMTTTLDRPIETENVSMALVRFDNGALGTISNSALSPREESRLRLDFQGATVELIGSGESTYQYTNANWHYSLPQSATDREALARWQAVEADVPGSHSAQVADFLDAMDRHERPLTSGAEARRIVEFIASLYKSAFTGQSVQRGSIAPEDPFYYSMNGSLQKSEDS